MRRVLVSLVIPSLVATLMVLRAEAPRARSFESSSRSTDFYDVREKTIRQLQADLTAGVITSRQLVEHYLDRIETYEDTLNAVISINPRAVQDADILDAERAAGIVRGPLHGIPIALKDNILTRDMSTTGGALAFEGFVPPYIATITENLQRAGAIIIAKTVMTELANWVTAGMPGNYSAVGGYGMNPYDPRPDPRPATSDGRPAMGTGGSSSGIGTAASLWAASVGTETSGSILSPSNANMLVGIKPTVARISRWGVIPITADQDIAGPMARTVEDAALLMGALDGFDPRDPATAICAPPPGHDYTRDFSINGLRGKRIGIPRANYYDAVVRPDTGNATGGLGAATDPRRAVMAEAIEVIQSLGATIVDPANIPSVVDGTPARNFLVTSTCTTTRQHDTNPNCSTTFQYGFKRDFNDMMATFGALAPVRALSELRAFNTANASRGAIKYGQTILDSSDAIDLARDNARYLADRARDVFLSDTHGIGEAIDVFKLDALLFPGSTSAGIAARPGFPTVIVPFGMIPNAPTPPFPAGFNALPQPYGVSFTSVACKEPELLQIAYAFEQATKRRVPPPGAYQ
ncbi:MAG: amidase [Acidobacteria bacterium]|nr:amidase [Acidobacteriota bacterium]